MKTVEEYMDEHADYPRENAINAIKMDVSNAINVQLPRLEIQEQELVMKAKMKFFNDLDGIRMV